MKRTIALIAILAGSLAAQMAGAAPAGTFILASGEVFVRDAAGVQRRATVGMPVESGETVLTLNGRAQVRFTDGGMVSLQPVTEFRITNYRFQEPGRTDDTALFNLLRGGLRAITGLIPERDRASYRMDTEYGYIGIRGTEFLAILCRGNCKEPDGLYVQTGEGIIFVRNAVGEIDVGKGQAAVVVSPDVAPQRTVIVPAVTAARPTTDTGAAAVAPAVTGVGTTSEFQPGAIVSAGVLGEVTPLTSAGLGLAGSGYVTYDGVTYPKPGEPTGGSAAGAFTSRDLTEAIGPGQTAVVGVYLSGNELRGATVSASEPGNSAFVTVTFDAVRNAGADGGLYWGRWSGTNLTASAGLNDLLQKESVPIPEATSIHYVLGTTVPTIPGTGTATYSFIGGTPATDQTGVVGSGITSGTLSANFLSNVVGADLKVNFKGADNVLTATMPMDPSIRARFSSELSGGVARAGPTANPGAWPANVSGFFAGSSSPTAPSRAGVAYDIRQPGVPVVVGVGGFGCSKGC